MKLTVLAGCALLLALLLAPAGTRAEPDPEGEAWRAQVAAARARAESYRAQLRVDLERRRIERLAEPEVPEDLERARRASEEVRNDYSLHKGDIISTVDGLFMFVGSSEGDRTPSDFVPLPPPQR